MKIETAIERLQELIDCNEKYEAFLTEEDDNDEELRDTELTLETLRMAVQALEEKPRWNMSWTSMLCFWTVWAMIYRNLIIFMCQTATVR
jgi:hypothetical protein